MQNLSVRQHFGIHFFLSVYIFLIQQLIGFIFGMHVPYATVTRPCYGPADACVYLDNENA